MGHWDLILEGKYEQSYEAYSEAIQKNPKDSLLYANRATASLCMKKYQEALTDLMMANEIIRKKNRISYAERIAGVQWLLGQKNECLTTLKKEINGLLNESIQYSDLAGGAIPGALLFAFAVLEGDFIACTEAQSFLSRIAIGKGEMVWPGHIALLILDKKTLQQILFDKFHAERLEDALSMETNGTKLGRNLCQLFFYAAIVAKARDDVSNYLDFMNKCSTIRGAYLEIEWFIAKELI
jgi:tetratricopeptide (TPR) repeat protein